MMVRPRNNAKKNATRKKVHGIALARHTVWHYIFNLSYLKLSICPIKQTAAMAATIQARARQATR
jgi:hypothetical protein